MMKLGACKASIPYFVCKNPDVAEFLLKEPRSFQCVMLPSLVLTHSDLIVFSKVTCNSQLRMSSN